MKKFVNGGIYQVNLNGKSNAEFVGEHPSLIIQTVSEKDLYYIIPLTTYTKERWQKDKEKFACRIKSTGSIALIDKMQVRHKSFIKRKSISKNFDPPLLVVPTPEEIENITKKLCSYITAATKHMASSYARYFEAYEEFKSLWINYIAGVLNGENLVLDGFVIYNEDENILSVKYKPSTTSSLLNISDVSYIIERHCPYRTTVNYQEDVHVFIIKIYKDVDKA